MRDVAVLKVCWKYFFALVLTAGLLPTAGAQPGVFVTAEGQLGDIPAIDDKVIGTRFESIRGAAGDVLLGGISVPGGLIFMPPEMQFLTDMIHGYPDPVPLDTTTSLFSKVSKMPPTSARSRNAAADGDFIAFSFAVDGVMPQTMSVRIATYDETGNSLINIPVTEIGTFPDPAFNKTGVAVDNQGRATVTYTELTSMFTVSTKAQRLDAVTGLPLGGEISIGDTNLYTDVALLDPEGNRLIITSASGVDVVGNILDTTGLTPQVLPEFPVSTTPGIVNANPAVAADPATGVFTVAWENFVDILGDPVNIRARRFDAMGNPIGNDFVVNTTTAGAQGQPAVAVGPGGESVVVWATDGAMPEDLDVLGQVYDAQGNPIGGEFEANTETAEVQDRPTVRFLPEPDAKGQPQFVVAWRDVNNTTENLPRGTGTSYKCFSIGEDPALIFMDGFESGETTSWSSDTVSSPLESPQGDTL